MTSIEERERCFDSVLNSTRDSQISVIILNVNQRTVNSISRYTFAADISANAREINQSQSQYSLFSLGMFTYTYERQDIIQIALKRLPGEGERCKKKGLSDLVLLLHIIILN
jgi:hypothetical protein